MAEENYWRNEDGQNFSKQDIRNADREEQKNLMRSWFLSKYENPAENMPYDSQEGGYIYIWGGPYDASEELMNEFGEFVSEKIIEELVIELEEWAVEWTGKAE